MVGDPFYEINPEIWLVCILQAEVCVGPLSSVNDLAVFAMWGHSKEMSLGLTSYAPTPPGFNPSHGVTSLSWCAHFNRGRVELHTQTRCQARYPCLGALD